MQTMGRGARLSLHESASERMSGRGGGGPEGAAWREGRGESDSNGIENCQIPGADSIKPMPIGKEIFGAESDFPLVVKCSCITSQGSRRSHRHWLLPTPEPDLKSKHASYLSSVGRLVKDSRQLCFSDL